MTIRNNRIKIKLPDGNIKEIVLASIPRSMEETRYNFLKYALGLTTPNIDTPYYYPCLNCAGVGSSYDPNDPPDPIEGNKLRNRIKCPKCKGAKTSTRAEFILYHKALKESRQKERAGQIQRAKILQAGLDKLTAEEYKLVKSVGTAFFNI